jgi:putative DNA primase/helicase
MQTPTSTLQVKRDGNIPNDVARLRGARLVSATETSDGQRLDEAFVKQATGRDRLAARFMRAEWFEFVPAFKLWLATNHRPEIRGSDHAIWRRIRLIPFNARFVAPEEKTNRDGELVQDRALGQKLRGELPGILAWAVEGCLEWQRDGLGLPEAVKDATADYREAQDPLGLWIEDKCHLIAGATTRASELYKSYTAWCAASGEESITRKAFGQRLAERELEPTRTHDDGRCWRGIALKVEEGRQW